ncbi:porin, partial [Rhizobium sp. CRIBSB]|nr:porin [Rhizobium sp. CRIBSB]
VRVCDAFGTGYFYIPGTETCLKISGEVRATLGINSADSDAGDDWDSAIRARVNFDAKNDSEIGTIGSFVRIQASSNTTFTGVDEDGNDVGIDGNAFVEQAYITVGGFKVGKAATFWDDLGTNGESDRFADVTVYNTISYTYASDAFTAGLGVDDTSEISGTNDVAIEAFASATFGVATVSVYGVYETELENGAVYGILSADLGPGKLELAGMYTTYDAGQNSTFIDSLPGSGVDLEWSVVAAYTFKATDKLSIAPSVTFLEDLDGTSAWGAGIYGEYALAQGLKASATVDYLDEDNQDELWSGFVRLTRSF